MLSNSCPFVCTKILYMTRSPYLITKHDIGDRISNVVDFINKAKKPLKRLFPIVRKTLRDVNVFTKEDKIVFTYLYLSDIHNQVENETSLRRVDEENNS